MTMPNAIHSLALMTHPSPPHAAVNPTASDLLSLCEVPRELTTLHDRRDNFDVRRGASSSDRPDRGDT